MSESRAGNVLVEDETIVSDEYGCRAVGITADPEADPTQAEGHNQPTPPESPKIPPEQDPEFAVARVAWGATQTMTAPERACHTPTNTAETISIRHPERLSRRRELRALRKTEAYKAAYNEILGKKYDRGLFKPNTWFHPKDWGEVERKVVKGTAHVGAVAIKATYDKTARHEINELLHKEVGRREMLGGVAVASAGILGTLAALEVRGRLNVIKRNLSKEYPENNPTFTFLGGQEYTGQKQIGIFFPGFGDIHSRKEAESWVKEGKIDTSTPVGFLDYSNQGTESPRELADLIRKSFKGKLPESVVLFGRSMGGPMAIAVAAELGIPVKSLVLCSSPFSINDGTYGNMGKLAANLWPDKQMATEAKLGTNAWQQRQPYGFDVPKILEHFPEILAEAWIQTQGGASPWALQKEVKFLANFDFNDKELRRKLHYVLIGGWTDVLYAEAKDTTSDRTVHDVASSHEFAQALQRYFDINLRIDQPFAKGHANVKQTARNLVPWIKRSMGPRPKPPRIVALGDGH